MTSSMKDSTSCNQRELSLPWFDDRLSCRRRLVSAAAWFNMMDSERASISLCHEVDSRAACACTRFAYSIGRSLSKFRPVVRTGSVSQGGAYRREHLYATRTCDRPVRASQHVSRLGRIVKCDSHRTEFCCEMRDEPAFLTSAAPACSSDSGL